MLSVVFSLVLAVSWRWYKTLFAVGLICISWIIYTSFQGPFALKRSTPNQVARFVAGKGQMEQAVDDLADEVSQPSIVAGLRAWAATVLSAQQEREVAFASVGHEWPYVEATDIPPPSVLVHYQAVLSQPAKTYLHVDAAGRVDGVMLSWANLRVGLVIVPGGRAPAIQHTFYERCPAPDIRVFCIAS
jgi:hypothetical protein